MQFPRNQLTPALVRSSRPHRKGTGVGMTLVRRIVEYHGGRTRIGSPEGGGCRVRFTLPPASETIARI